MTGPQRVTAIIAVAILTVGIVELVVWIVELLERLAGGTG